MQTPSVPSVAAYDPAAEEATAKAEAKKLSKTRKSQESDTVKTTPLGLYGQEKSTKKKTLLG